MVASYTVYTTDKLTNQLSTSKKLFSISTRTQDIKSINQSINSRSCGLLCYVFKRDAFLLHFDSVLLI